jgi:hypothetical protein
MGRALFAVACAAAACSSPARSEPRRRLDSVLIEHVPHVRQKPDFCGEACVEMWARHEGKTYDQDAVFAETGLDPALGRGAYTPDLVRAVKRLGFAPPTIYAAIDATDGAHLQAGLDGELAKLHADLERGVPSIVCMHYDDRPHTTEHFRLVVGYDADKDEVVYQEPAEDNGGYRRIRRALFEKLWPLPGADADHRTVIRIPLVRGKLADPSPIDGAFTPAEYAQHVMTLRTHLADLKLGSLTIRIEDPFVVIGDSNEATLARDASTVRWAADHLERDFFTNRPRKILDVYLFHDASSYERGVKTLTGEAPTTPYGFYSSTNEGLFMNIATGGGTLVHEIVHPYVEADFPNAPPWLNEGLGSLFEQSSERDGHIVGLTNWRLAGLQRAIANDSMPTFKTLTHLGANAFYGDDSGVNYAASRYVLYYLQDKGLLREFYRAFRAARAKDPSGYATLTATLGERDMADFQARWQAYVANLTFP